MTCYKTPLWDFNTDRTTSTREHLNTVTRLSLTWTTHTHQRHYRKNTRGKHTHEKYNNNNIRICHRSYLRQKESAILKTTTSKCGSPTCTSYRTVYDLTLNSWRFLSWMFPFKCRRPWPQCRAQVTVYWATRKTHAISTVSQVEMCPEAVVYKYTLSLSHFFGFVFGQFYQHALVTASVRGMERREAGLPVWLFLGQIQKKLAFFNSIWPPEFSFGLWPFFQNNSHFASFWLFNEEKLAFPWVLPFFSTSFIF